MNFPGPLTQNRTRLYETFTIRFVAGVMLSANVKSGYYADWVIRQSNVTSSVTSAGCKEHCPSYCYYGYKYEAEACASSCECAPATSLITGMLAKCWVAISGGNMGWFDWLLCGFLKVLLHLLHAWKFLEFHLGAKTVVTLVWKFFFIYDVRNVWCDVIQYWRNEPLWKVLVMSLNSSGIFLPKCGHSGNRQVTKRTWEASP